jgi:hypothetical protein
LRDFISRDNAQTIKKMSIKVHRRVRLESTQITLCCKFFTTFLSLSLVHKHFRICFESLPDIALLSLWSLERTKAKKKQNRISFDLESLLFFCLTHDVINFTGWGKREGKLYWLRFHST